MQEGTNLLAEHYQKTFEVTLEVWNQRNKTFLLLLAVVGGATLLTFNAAQAQPLLVDLIAKLLSIQDASRHKELRASFPYGLIQAILLMIVLYLTLVLYHRTMFIQRSYKYLGKLEGEIRSGLNLDTTSAAFTREGAFYEGNTPRLRHAVAIAYVGMLGLLLLAFLGMRIFSDFAAGSYLLGILDVLVASPTLLFFGAYASAS
jgi:hypothetical protein